MALANRVIIEPPATLLDCFIIGLKDDIRREVVAQNPVSLLRAMSLAKLYKEKYVTTFKSHYSPSHTKSHPQNNTFHTRNKSLPLLPTPTTRPTVPTSLPRNVKKTSATEMQLHKKKGLCYTCDEKFNFNKKCPTNTF